MADITPIRPDVASVKAPKKSVRSKKARLDKTDTDDALNAQRYVLFQAMGIVRMAERAIREPEGPKSATDAWTAMQGAYVLLSSVADRLESTEALLAADAPPKGYY